MNDEAVLIDLDDSEISLLESTGHAACRPGSSICAFAPALASLSA
jgi:hypothetical protein